MTAKNKITIRREVVISANENKAILGGKGERRIRFEGGNLYAIIYAAGERRETRFFKTRSVAVKEAKAERNAGRDFAVIDALGVKFIVLDAPFVEGGDEFYPSPLVFHSREI